MNELRVLDDLEPEEVKKEFFMFRRSDSKQWNKGVMLMTGWLLVPIRLVMMGVVACWMVFGYGTVRWLPSGRIKKTGYNIVSYIVGRLFLLACGY